jgi:hypothetical protein
VTSFASIGAPVYNAGCVKSDAYISGMLRLRLLATPASNAGPLAVNPTQCGYCSIPVLTEPRFCRDSFGVAGDLRASLSDLEMHSSEGFEYADSPSELPSLESLRGATHVRPEGIVSGFVHAQSCLCQAASRSYVHNKIVTCIVPMFTRKGFRVDSSREGAPSCRTLASTGSWLISLLLHRLPRSLACLVAKASVLVTFLFAS